MGPHKGSAGTNRPMLVGDSLIAKIRQLSLLLVLCETELVAIILDRQLYWCPQPIFLGGTFRLYPHDLRERPGMPKARNA